MSNITQQVESMKTSVFGADISTKAYSIRIPLDLSAEVEAVTTISGKSRNIIVNDLMRLGMACFMEHLDSEQMVNIKKAIELEQIELHVEHMGGK